MFRMTLLRNATAPLMAASRHRQTPRSSFCSHSQEPDRQRRRGVFTMPIAVAYSFTIHDILLFKLWVVLVISSEQINKLLSAKITFVYRNKHFLQTSFLAI